MEGKTVNSDLIRIISKAASGNSDGTRQLRERIMPYITAFVKKRTGTESPQIAEYIFQTVVERLNELENAKQFYHWLEIIENEIIESVITQPDHYSPDQSTEILQKAMSTFTDDQRTVFLMHYYDGKTVSDIAREIHKDEDVVEGILNRAKTKLTEQISTLQTKEGLKLYDLAPLPFVLYLIRICKGAGVAKTAISTSAVSMVAGSYSGAAVGSSAAVSTGAATSASAASAGTAAAAGAATKAAGISIATKVAVSAAVTVAAAGGGYTAYRAVENHHEEVAEAAAESDSVSSETGNNDTAADEADAVQEETTQHVIYVSDSIDVDRVDEIELKTDCNYESYNLTGYPQEWYANLMGEDPIYTPDALSFMKNGNLGFISYEGEILQETNCGGWDTPGHLVLIHPDDEYDYKVTGDFRSYEKIWDGFGGLCEPWDGGILIGDEEYTLDGEVTYYVNGYATLIKDGKYGIFDTGTKTMLADCIYEDMKFYEEGYIPAKKDGKWGYLDQSGTAVTDFVFDDATTLYNGMAVVKVNGTYRSLNLKGTLDQGISITAETIQ